jgi:hypothetical protein
MTAHLSKSGGTNSGERIPIEKIDAYVKRIEDRLESTNRALKATNENAALKLEEKINAAAITLRNSNEAIARKNEEKLNGILATSANSSGSTQNTEQFTEIAESLQKLTDEISLYTRNNETMLRQISEKLVTQNISQNSADSTQALQIQSEVLQKLQDLTNEISRYINSNNALVGQVTEIAEKDYQWLDRMMRNAH